MRSTTKAGRWLAGAFVVTAVAAGCSSESGEGGDDAGGAKKAITVGVSVDFLSPGRQAELSALKDAARQAGISLRTSVADEDAQRQNSQIQSLVTQKIDAIIVVAVDQKAITSSTKAATDADVPVVTMDRELPDDPNVTFHAGFDSYADGKLCGEFMARKAQEAGRPGVVLELLGALNDDNAIQRSKGFEDGLKAATNLKIVKGPTEWDANKALAATENALQANPDLWGVQIPADFMISSVETALKGAGRLAKASSPKHVVSCAIDGSEPGYKSTVAGTNDALVALPLSKLGRITMEAARKVAGGEKLAERKRTFPGTLYTTENVKDNADKIWGARSASK